MEIKMNKIKIDNKIDCIIFCRNTRTFGHLFIVEDIWATVLQTDSLYSLHSYTN